MEGKKHEYTMNDLLKRFPLSDREKNFLMIGQLVMMGVLVDAIEDDIEKDKSIRICLHEATGTIMSIFYNLSEMDQVDREMHMAKGIKEFHTQFKKAVMTVVEKD